MLTPSRLVNMQFPALWSTTAAVAWQCFFFLTVEKVLKHNLLIPLPVLAASLSVLACMTQLLLYRIHYRHFIESRKQ